MRSADYAKTVEWDRPVNVVVTRWADEVMQLILAGLERIVRKYAPLIEQWMKQNAPWKDITGNARAGLHAEVGILVGRHYDLYLDHSDAVPYGSLLELKNQGKFAIIQPALDHWQPIIFNEVARFLNG